MTRPLLSFGVTLLLTACATSGGGETEGGAPPAGGTELYIRDYMETYLPREAYIAFFEIIPERGVSLLYPTRGEEPRQVGPGWFRLPHSPSGFVHAQRDRYLPVMYGRIQSVVFMVVTSDLPLNLDPLLAAPSALRDRLGTQAYIDDNRAVERILGTIVPDPVAASVSYRIASVPVPVAWAIRR